MRDDEWLTIRVDHGLLEDLDEEARASGQTREELIRRKLATGISKRGKKTSPSQKPAERAKRKKPESAYEAFRRLGLIGAAKDLPPDLSSNPKYMEGFGQ